MKLTNLRNTILNESSLFNRKSIDIENNINYNKEGIKDIVGYINYSYELFPENYDLLNAFSLLDNGTTLYINSQLILDNANAKWCMLRIDFDKLFLNNPIFGDKIKKLKIGFIGENRSKRQTFKIESIKGQKQNGDISYIDNITIEYENPDPTTYQNPYLINLYKFGKNIKLINMVCQFKKKFEKVGMIYDTNDPNSFVMNGGIRTELSNHISKKKLEYYFMLYDDFKPYSSSNDFYRVLNNHYTYDLLLTSTGNFKTFKIGLPFTTKHSTNYIMIRVKDSSMESSLKSNYLNYYNKMEIFKYENYGDPEKRNNIKEVQKIEKKYGYFIIFSEPIF